MQHKSKEYDREKHDRWYALSVKQPWASHIANGNKTIEVRSHYLNYRGDVMICSSASPSSKDMPGGVTLCLAELYDVKKICDFTDKDWALTMIPEPMRPKEGYGWKLRNIRRVVEFPVKGQLGLWRLVYTKGNIVEVPKHLRYDKKLKTWVFDAPQIKK